MIEKTVEEIEARILVSKTLEESQKKELLKLVAGLKTEVVQLAQTHEEAAGSIADFARVTAAEGLKAERNPKLFTIAVEGIHASVAQFERTHPVLTRAVNDISTYFANIGI